MMEWNRIQLVGQNYYYYSYDPSLVLKTRVSVCDTGSSVRWVVGEESEECSMCECVFMYSSVFGELTLSEVVFETAVRAPNLLIRLPSVFTDTVSFWNCHRPLYRLSWPASSPSRFPLTVSLSSEPTPVFFFNTHLLCHTMAVPPSSWIPSLNLFVQVSFLALICENHISACHCF